MAKNVHCGYMSLYVCIGYKVTEKNFQTWAILLKYGMNFAVNIFLTQVQENKGGMVTNFKFHMK